MPFWAAVGAITGLAGSVLGATQQQSAADKANALAKAQAEAQFDRAKKEWKIDYLNQKANWAWDVAKIEAQKYIEKQKESDYNWRAGRLIDAAMQNLQVNTAALQDRFVTEENLRATQVGMELGAKVDALTAQSGEAVRQYMAGIRDTALQSTQIINQTQRESQELLSSMVFDMQRDQLQWEMGQVAAVIDDAQAAATASARLGGSDSAQRLAINAAQKLGRTWGEMDIRSRSRDARIGLMNTSMRGETAVQLGRMALQVQDQAEKIKYTNSRYAADTTNELKAFGDLTIPGFQLAARQGQRELTSLQIQTQSQLDEASMPYRKAIFFDPIKPIKGLKPEYMAPTQVYSPGAGSMIGGAILSGIQGAINLGTYTDSTGAMKWR